MRLLLFCKVELRFHNSPSCRYYPALLPALCNCLTMLGFLAVNAILGGQTLSLASGSNMSYDVGIVVVGIISLIVSGSKRFLDSRALI